MATSFMGGQSGYDEAGNTVSPQGVVPKALAPSPVSPSVPGITPKLPTGAPPANAAGLPTTPDKLLDDSNAMQKLGGAQVKDLGQLQGLELGAAQKASELTSQANIAQSQNTLNQEVSRTKIQQEIADQQKQMVEQKKKDLQESSPFAPTPERAKDLAGVFSLLTLATFGSGGQGKYSGMNALRNMTGAMKGYQEGRKDVFEHEMKEFDKNLLAIKSHNDKVEKLFNDGMTLLATNKELGEQKIKEAAALSNTGIVSQLARAGRYTDMSKAIQTVSAPLRIAEQRMQKLKDDYALLEKRFQNEKSMESIRNTHQKELEEMRIAGQKDVAQVRANAKNQSDDVQSDLASRGVHISDKKGRAIVEDVVGTKAKLNELKSQIQNDPSLVGRQGMIRQFSDRYYESFKNGKPFDDSNVPENDQAALRFAKNYASMLTRYERALSGSGRTTVSFQQQYNALLSQNQFNAAGLSRLLDDLSREVDGQALTQSPKLTSAILDEMATDFQGRLGDESGAPAQTSLPDNPNRHYLGSEPIIPNKDNTGWIYERTGKPAQ